jgi:hypothetical protein
VELSDDPVDEALILGHLVEVAVWNGNGHVHVSLGSKST